MAKANDNAFISAYKEELLASKAAERLREKLRNSETQTEMEKAAAAEPSPWDDMGDTDDGVFHVDQFGYVSIQVPRGTGVPCTESHTHHAGICTFEDVLLAQMVSL